MPMKPAPDSAGPGEPGEAAPGNNAHTSTRAVLDAFAEGDPEDHLRLGDLLSGLRQTAFGMLLFVGVLPAFIPIPGLAGAISGPVVMLIGAQLLIGLRKPWLPQFMARRGPHRQYRMATGCCRTGPRLDVALPPRINAATMRGTDAP